MISMQTVIDYLLWSPEITLLAGACGVLLSGAFSAAKSAWVYSLTQLVLLLVLALCLYPGLTSMTAQLYNGFYIIDELSILAKSAMCVFMIIVLIYSRGYIDTHGFPKGEYYALALFSLLGMLLVSSASHLLMIYLGLELLSLSLYALVAIDRDHSPGSEAAIKYFVLGAIASGFLLYGISLLYGLTGTLYLSELGDSAQPGLGLTAALVFIVIGLAFKLGAVPFHMWLPDVYQGAPLSVTLLIASVPKIAGILLALRLLMDGLQFADTDWRQSLRVLAVLSLLAGNVIAIAQTNIRRMLAYSTIGHVGYILLGLLTAGPSGYAAALFYTLIYVLMSSAVFGSLLCIETTGRQVQNLTDLTGLAKFFPWLSFLILLLMFSMAGIPMTVGFYAKLNILQALIAGQEIILAVIAVISSVIGAYYYLRVIKIIYFDTYPGAERANMPAGHLSVLSVHALLVVVLFLFPQPLLELCLRAIG